MEGKRLYKSTKDKKICGVCGGLAEYFEVDPTCIRLAWALAVCVGRVGLLAYFVAALVLPKEPEENISNL